jgi:dipeptidase
MCDTLIALGNSTADGSVLFAKNSDREPNEAHQIISIPASDHPKGSQLNCTYRNIPQVEHTYAVVLSKPFWMWGAEMGTNEFGVVIGNEAVFTKVPQEKTPSLTGMDLLRLALERAATAREALNIITTLLQTYGQGGNCGFAHPMNYHNSFLIGDRREGWVLETAGREWAAQRVQGVRSISNAISIGSDWDEASPGLVDYAMKRGWCRGLTDFDFARCYSEPIYTRFGAGKYRQQCTSSLLQEKACSLTAADLMAYLRYHGGKDDAGWTPDKAVLGTEVCMHYGFGPVRINQTTGSMVSRLAGDGMTHWMTGTAAPCTSVFKPVWVEAGIPEEASKALTGKADDQSMWWLHEKLHRQVNQDYANRLPNYRQERDRLETEFIQGAERVSALSIEEKSAFSEECFNRAAEATREWTACVRAVPVKKAAAIYYRQAWKKINAEAGLTD